MVESADERHEPWVEVNRSNRSRVGLYSIGGRIEELGKEEAIQRIERVMRAQVDGIG